jgi:hypothetical protein
MTILATFCDQCNWYCISSFCWYSHLMIQPSGDGLCQKCPFQFVVSQLLQGHRFDKELCCRLQTRSNWSGGGNPSQGLLQQYRQKQQDQQTTVQIEKAHCQILFLCTFALKRCDDEESQTAGLRDERKEETPPRTTFTTS